MHTSVRPCPTRAHTYIHTSELEDSALLVNQLPNLSAMLTRVTELEVRETGGEASRLWVSVWEGGWTVVITATSAG